MSRRRTLIPARDADHAEPLELSELAENFEAVPEVEQSAIPEFEESWEYEEARPRRRWLAPGFATLAALGWTGFFGWVNHRAMLAGAAPAQWLEWIVQYCVPLVLIGGLYILIMRSSSREADRFTLAAAALGSGSERLSARLKVVNRELALARDFIEAQSRDLETLGRLAGERLSTHADRLQGLIRDNSAQVESIGRVSESALGNLEALRDQLPVLNNAARDMNNQIGSVGGAAQDHANALVAALEQLDKLGEAGKTHVNAVTTQVGDLLRDLEARSLGLTEEAKQRFHALAEQIAGDSVTIRQKEEAASAITRQRLATIRGENETIVGAMEQGYRAVAERWSQAITNLDARMKQVLEGIVKIDETAMTNARTRLQSLNQEAHQVDQRMASSMATFETQFSERRDANLARETEALAALETQIAGFDQRIAERQQEHLAHAQGMAERGEALVARFATLDEQIRGLGSQIANLDQTLGTAAEQLADRLTQSRASLQESGQFVTRITDDAVRMLEIIRAGTDHSEGALADSVGKAEARLAAMNASAVQLHGLIGEAEGRGGKLAEQIEAVRGSGSASLEELQALEAQLVRVSGETEQLAQRTSSELRNAIELLSQSSANVLENLRGAQSEEVQALARQLSEASSEQLAAAMRTQAAESLAQLQTASERADAAGLETAQRLQEELERVNALAANLERRVAEAREQAEEHTDGDFTRRMALITEALNSTAIDLAKVFDNDVTDTQWASYLRGDRGVFTRRAVRLLDRQDERSVSEVYQSDADFRLLVNRYIHDFEGMLRGVLSTRDGNAMAVMMLSSDIGKLYVALAQAIERLRD